jgi:hypothetical protein
LVQEKARKKEASARGRNNLSLVKVSFAERKAKTTFLVKVFTEGKKVVRR